MPTRREQAERRLGAALSRHIGYTTGAFDLNRILNIPNLIGRQSHLLAPVLERRIQEIYPVGVKYSRGILDFATAIGVITRRGGRETLAKYSLSHVGRGLLAAEHAEEPKVRNLIVLAAVLESDVDAYYSVLWASLGCAVPRANREFLQRFRRCLVNVRHKRIGWLAENFPNPKLRHRIREHVLWWKRGKWTEVRDDFVRHHARPRFGWAQMLGHRDDDGVVTPAAERLMKKLRGGNESFFWLGPSEEDLATLRIGVAQRIQPLGGAWDLLRPSQLAREVPEKLIHDLGEYMRRSYSKVRLVTANQAPTQAVMPFVYQYEMTQGVRYQVNDVMQRLLRYQPSVFTAFRSMDGVYGFYRIRP